MKQDLDLDISAVPFSRFGSYTAVSLLEGERHAKNGLPEGVWLRCVHGDALYEVMQFEMVEDGDVVRCDTSRTASILTLKGKAGVAEICMPTPTTVRIRLRGATMRITARFYRNHGAIPEPDGNWVFALSSSFRSYRLVPLAGALSVDAPWEVKRCKHIIAELSADDGNTAELAIEELTWMRPAQDHNGGFDALAESVQAEFEDFCKPFLNCPEERQTTAIKAAYVDWSAVVHPHGLITRPAMYMSKNWMTNVWAWDHAFNALAVSLTNCDLAWDQMMAIFDHQNENGQIPDFIDDVRYLTNFVKPPIHGWILKRMIEFGGALPADRLEQAYQMLSKWTNWWFNYRDPDGDGLPVYWHGNDSGWDNCTVFDVPFPVKAPDLSAFLVVQMDTLAGLAADLDHGDESKTWRERADATLASLIDTLWNGNKFRCISTVTGEEASPSDSVFNCLPIILGDRLPQDIRDSLAAEIGRHLTEWGPPTEHPDSPKYDPNGYWRGPIWAPSTMILIDGLRSAGQTKLAREIAQRFCRLCEKSGFAENFDAVAGAPLCDPAYTWTSSVFLVLANRYLQPA